MKRTRKHMDSLHSLKKAIDKITCKKCGLRFSIFIGRKFEVKCPYCKQSLVVMPKGETYEIDWRDVC